MEAVKDASHLYEVEHRAQHAARPGFRIQELRLSRTQKVPWHFHNNVQDTFYVLEGELRIFLQEPKEEVRLKPGETFTARAQRPAPRHQCRRESRDLPGAAGHR
jgi:mannose-6-phosphate isomerase-like protein (cupin superfamily)